MLRGIHNSEESLVGFITWGYLSITCTSFEQSISSYWNFFFSYLSNNIIGGYLLGTNPWQHQP